MPRCNLCLKNHALRHCQVFVAKSIKERRAYINQWKYCLNCMAQTHTRAACQSLNRCAICEAKHHSMLHRERPHDVTSSSFEEEAAPSSSVNRTFSISRNQPNVSEHVPTDNTLQAVSILERELPTKIPPKCNYIPPLVRVNLYHQGNPMWVTFLLDPESESSYLKRSVANIFPNFAQSLQEEDKDFSMFQVSASYEPRCHQNPIARWRLAIIEFAVDLPPAIKDPRLTKHFKNVVPQAHPSFATCREVDGVIGGRTLETIMLNGRTAEENLPEIQLSIFGWVISGQWNGCSCH